MLVGAAALDHHRIGDGEHLAAEADDGVRLTGDQPSERGALHLGELQGAVGEELVHHNHPCRRKVRHSSAQIMTITARTTK